MMDRSTIFTVGAAIVALLVVLELVRRRRLSEEYSLLWLGTAAAMLLLGLWRDLLHQLAQAVNIYDPTNLLFLLALLFLLFIQAVLLDCHHALDAGKQRSRAANRPAAASSLPARRCAGR